MYVLRPSHIRTTPQLIADDIGCETRKWPGWASGVPDFKRDFFMIYPQQHAVNHGGSEYAELRHFFSRDKAGQRVLIGEAGIKTPQIYRSKHDIPVSKYTASDRFVVRPLYHSLGEEYRITHDPRDFIPGEEYISEFFPKEREYRILFVFGKPTIFWQKRPPEEATQEDPWGTEASSFLTITDWANSYLRLHTQCFADLAKHSVLRSAHIVGVDILYGGHDYRVLEYNVCPGLTINRNRATVVDLIKKKFDI